MPNKVSVSRDANSGRIIIEPDKREFRGGFQPKYSPNSTLPKLPKSKSAIGRKTNK